MIRHMDINQIVTMIAALLFAVTIHEVAHGYVAYRQGDPTAKLAGRLTLNPLKHLDIFGSILLPLMLKLTGSPFIFGYAKPVPVDFSRLRNPRLGTLWVASAGVSANLGCALAAGGLFQLVLYFESVWQAMVVQPLLIDLSYLLFYSVVINSILAVFNLIPIPPLDGSRILALLLPPQLAVQFARLGRFGLIILIFLLLTDVPEKVMTFFLIPLIDFFLGR